MRLPLKLASLFALALVIVPSLLYFTGNISHAAVVSIALVGTILWFATTPFWIGREIPVDADQVEI